MIAVRRRCGWCGKKTGKDKKSKMRTDNLPLYLQERILKDGYIVTHGICQPCADKMLVEGGK